MNYLDVIAAQIRDRTDPELLPKGDHTLLFQLYALLAMAKGTSVTSADVHNAWVVWMLQADAHHASVQAFDDLTADVQAADAPFVTAIQAIARGL